MPTYVYKFVETGETIEVQQAFTDDALTEATHPGSGDVMAVKKVFTPVGVTFKGGGFYKTDSRGGSASRARRARRPAIRRARRARSSEGSSTSTIHPVDDLVDDLEFVGLVDPGVDVIELRFIRIRFARGPGPPAPAAERSGFARAGRYRAGTDIPRMLFVSGDRP